MAERNIAMRGRHADLRRRQADLLCGHAAWQARNIELREWNTPLQRGILASGAGRVNCGAVSRKCSRGISNCGAVARRYLAVSGDCSAVWHANRMLNCSAEY